MRTITWIRQGLRAPLSAEEMNALEYQEVLAIEKLLDYQRYQEKMTHASYK